LNAETGEKLQAWEWLISAILVEFNHLRGLAGSRLEPKALGALQGMDTQGL